MKSFSTLVKIYLVAGTLIAGWFIVAASSGWKAPNLGIVDGMASSGGRSSGGYWGGGK